MGKGRKQGRDSQIFPFHYLVTSALSGGTGNFFVSPNGTLTPRGQTEADAWQHFRVKRLSFRLHPNQTRTGVLCVGYCGGVPDTAPSTVAQVMELLPSTALGIQSTVPSEWVHVPAIDLAGPLPWYKTVPGGADVTEEQPGIICLAGTGTDGWTLEMRGILEFKTSSATANTPLAVSVRQQLRDERIRTALLRERDLLLRILNATNKQPAALGLPSPVTGV